MKHTQIIAQAIFEALKEGYNDGAIVANPEFRAHTDFFDDQAEEPVLFVEHHEDGNSVNVYATTLNLNEISKIFEVLGQAELQKHPVKEVPFIAAQVTPFGIPFLHLLIEIR